MTNEAILLEANEKMSQTIQLQAEQIQLLTEQVNYLTEKLFGKSKETMDPALSGQLSLFGAQKIEEPVKEEIIKVGGHKRKKKKGRKQAILDQLPTQEVHHRLEGDACHCPNCDHQLKEIGSHPVSQEVVFQPATLRKDVHIQHAYKCEHCSLINETDVIVKADTPKQPIGNSFGSASVVTETIHQKYELKVPAYRQIEDWKTLGLPITRTNITDWHIKVTDYYLNDFYHLLKDQLLTQDILHCDETTYKVIESDTAKTYYWVAESSAHHNQPVVLYYHNQSRSGRVIKEFLNGYSGYIHCDMWGAYQQLQEVTLVGCFAHVRRKFYDALPTNSTYTDYSAQAVAKIDKLFELEREWQPLSNNERFEKRQEILKPKLEEFFEWIGTIDALPKTALGKAIEYTLKFQRHFLTVLEDGRLELSNNRAERAVKTLVMGRKNWLFSTSFDGAKSTATILSILETAKANGLNSRQYMQYLLEELPQLVTMKNPELLAAYLPWHPNIQAKFKKNDKIPY